MSSNVANQLVPAKQLPYLSTGRGGYTLTMREDEQTETVLAKLESDLSSTGEKDRLHVGWGSFRNLDIVAARQSDYVILLDINKNQFDVWRAVTKALGNADSVERFIDSFVASAPKDPPLRQFASSLETWLRSDIKRPGSWLNVDKSWHFEHIRQLFSCGNVVTYCMDIRGVYHENDDLIETFQTNLAQTCRRNSIQPDTFYLSNLPWMMQKSHGFFGESHATACAGSPRDALSATKRNIESIATLFSHVVTAIRLASYSTAQDLQWRTECFSPEELVTSASWNALELLDNSAV